MTAKVPLRAASVFLTIFGFGHTVGGMLMPTSHGPEEDAALAALAAYKFNTMGFVRSHADFYRGEGFYLSLAVFLFAAMCWQLGSLSVEHPQIARRMLWLPASFSLGSTLLCVTYFFTAPLVASALAFLAISIAMVMLTRSSS